MAHSTSRVMMRIAHLLYWSLWLVEISSAADCDGSQSIVGSPRSDEIAAYLANALNGTGSGVCAGGFPLNSDGLTNTFNANEMFFTVTRTSTDISLSYCNQAFTNIINQCVQGQKEWGGQWSLGGQTYTIKNNVYPDNGIALPGSSSATQGTTTTSTASGTYTGAPTTTTTAGSGGNNYGSAIVIQGTGDQGPITIPPQTSTETGTFSTTYISDITANTVTTTSLSDSSGPTILPIWFCKTCIAAAAGILIIPAAAPAAGGLIPPPPGFPALAIGPDGQANPVGDPAPGQQPSGDPRATGSGDDTQSTVTEPEPTGNCEYWGSTSDKRGLNRFTRGRRVIRQVNVHHIKVLFKRAEAEMIVARPLISALQALGGSDALNSATDLDLVVNSFPKIHENRFVTGLQGKVANAINIKYEGNTIKMSKGDLFRIRWDYDPGAAATANSPAVVGKGVHVNAEFFGSQTTTKIAFFPKNKPIVDNPTNRNNVLFQQVLNDQSNTLDYSTRPNPPGPALTPGQRTGETDPGLQQTSLQNMAKQLAQRWTSQDC